MVDVITKRPGQQGDTERPPLFMATPERVSQYLELRTEEVTAQMKSVEGRQQLFQELMKHEEALRKEHADFEPRALQAQLEVAGEALAANERYLQEIRVPEKKGIFRRAWETVQGFPRKHPVTTALLAVGVVAGGVAGALYLSGYLQLAQLGAAAEAVRQFLRGADTVNRGIGPMPDFNPYHGVPPGQ